MKRSSLLLLSLALTGTLATAQSSPAVQHLLKSRYALASETEVHDFLAEVVRLGLAPTWSEVVQAQELFLHYVGKNAEAIDAQRQVRDSLAAKFGGGSAASPTAITETEFNDLAAWADTFTDSDTGTGTLGPGDSRDVYRWVVTQDSDCNIQLTTTAASVPLLNLVDADARLVQAATLVGTTRSINMALAAGTYYILIGTSTVAQTYTLTTRTSPTRIPVLSSGVPVNGGFTQSPEVHTYRIDLRSDSVLNLNMTNQAPGTANFAFSLGREKGGRIYFQDNTIVPPATVATNDPILTCELPAGTYYVFAYEVLNSTTALYTLTATVTPTRLRAFPCGTTDNDTFVDGSNRFLYRLTLAGAERITASIVGGIPAPTSTDSYFEMFDAEMGMIVHNDDSTSRGLLSYLDISLPAGTYYFGIRTFSQTNAAQLGNYVLTGVCNQRPTFTPLEAMRSGPLNLPIDSHIAFTYAPRTDSPLRFQSTLQVSLLSQRGLLRAYHQLTGPGLIGEVSTNANARETLYGILRTASNTASATATAIVQGGLTIDPRGTTLLSLDKTGRTHILFAGLGTAASPLASYIPGVTGNILLDIGMPVFALGTAVTDGNGRISWPFVINGRTPPIYLQAISIDSAMTEGYFTIVTP